MVGLLASETPVRDAVRQFGANVLLALDKPEGGFIRLQYGLGRPAHTERDVYIIDADLYTEVRHGGENVDATLGQFNREAGNLFRWTIEPPLRDALGERNDELHALPDVSNEFMTTGPSGFLATVSGFDCTVSFQSNTPHRDALKRLLGCLAVLYMPPQGLDETLRTCVRRGISTHANSSFSRATLQG